MAKLDIRSDFVDGMYEVFSTLFNDGSEGTDGIFLYLMSENTKGLDPYSENKYKYYTAPKLLVAKAVLNPTQGELDVLGIKIDAEFTVPIKSLQDNGFQVTFDYINEKLLKGVIKFQNVYYQIDLINPKAYVEDVFLFYAFSCTELRDFEMVIEDNLDEETIIAELLEEELKSEYENYPY